jgi:hypothetical protein
MVAAMAGSMPDAEGISTRSTVPVQINLQGSATGIRKTISIRLLGSSQSPARNKTPADPMFSVYPENQISVPTRRNSMGKFKANLVLTPHRMPWRRDFVYATKVLILPDQAMMDREQRQLQPIRHASLVKDVPEVMLDGLLSDR